MSEQVQNQQIIGAGGAGLFGDDDDDEVENGQHQQQQQQLHQQQMEQYQNDLGLDDDVLGLDDAADAAVGGGVRDEELMPADHESGLLMRFCPHDSSMLYPKVCVVGC